MFTEFIAVLWDSSDNLHYEWAVNRISADYRPDAPEETFILVHRNLDDNIDFTEINAMTHALGIFIQQKTEKNKHIRIKSR